MLSLEHTPMPMLPSFDDVVPHAPKRARRTSESLERRVRANLNVLSIPDIQGPSSAPAPSLLLAPQGRISVAGLSFDKILLNGAQRSKQQPKKSHVLAPLRSPKRNSATPPLILKPSPNAGPNSLLALRMASMVKGSTDAKAQLKFGGIQKSFQVPGRARSSPYQSPSRALPTRALNRSFNALCA